MKIKRIDQLNSLPLHKQILEVIKISLNFKIKIRDLKEYLNEETEIKE